MKIRILDLDNCISDDEWRIHFIDWEKKDPEERYRTYHYACNLDQFKNRNLVEGRGKCESIVIFTARPNSVRKQTAQWLRENGIKILSLHMRDEGDNSSSVEVKRKMLEDLKELMQDSEIEISCAYDDKEDIVEMYRSFGIDAHVVSIHSTSAYHQEK